MENRQIEGNVVLVVDDDEINLQVAKVILEKKLPCRVITADSGVEGLEILRRQYVRVVLLDIMMPEMDGIEVLQKIRADKKIKDTPVMMLTASTDKEDIQQAIKLNVKDYIRKPFLPEELVARVSNKLIVKKNADVAKILVIDDDEQNLKALQRILENHFPHEILTANSGIDGLEILHESAVDLVIANSGMRLITGFRILDFIKREDRFNKIRVILFADELDRDLLVKINNSMAEGIITLPLKAEEVVSAVTGVLNVKPL